MPFGAELREDGSTRFRLWAPGARKVLLELGGDAKQRSIPLGACGGGWFEVVCPETPAGTRYAYRVDDGDPAPDPASRANPEDVHAPSMIVDPHAYTWEATDWHGRPWHEAVVYELHVGTFTPQGTFVAAIERLDHLVALGATAIELMPVADFAGTRNWGYDGVLLFAPDASYGTPADMKRLVDAAHARGLMVLLDVVYNHFGPEGNYLKAIAPAFFNPAHRTPWGDAINFDGDDNRTVRDFYIHNALYWLDEYNLDGLRFDAVHAIVDTSPTHIVTEITTAIRRALPAERHVHLVLENDQNAARFLERDERLQPVQATAQWNDDAHHAAHLLITGERDSYYMDYASDPLQSFARTLAEGFAYQGERSPFRDEARGERSAHLPPLAFIGFLQNHDQVGNRAFGERITGIADPVKVRAAAACLLLAPSPPLLFMGEEFGASTPFLFFCDFGEELANAVSRGRREEFKRFPRFADPATRAQIPDPNAPETFERSRLAWAEIEEPEHAAWHAFYRSCLAVRRDVLVPHLAGIRGDAARYGIDVGGVLSVRWALAHGAEWYLDANLSDEARPAPRRRGMVAFAANVADASQPTADTLPPWCVRFILANAVAT